MANMVDQDQQWRINCLNATLDTNNQVRSFAEAFLHQASLQPVLLHWEWQILALLADVLIEIQEQVMGGDDVDSKWEEAQAGDAEDVDLLYSVDATSFSRPSYEHLDAMAKVLNEDQDGDEEGLLIGADTLK